MAWDYTEKTIRLFMDAVSGKPGTHMGEIENPDGVGEHGSIACGDALRFTFRVERHPQDPRKDVIVEARYLTFGCTSAIAASEALCALIEAGRYTPIQALDISNEDIVEFLGGLPDEKIHCSVMGAEALQAAVFDWARKRGVDLSELGVDITPEELRGGRIVCECFGLTDRYLERKIRDLGLRSVGEITSALKAGGACGKCRDAPGGLQDLLTSVWGEPEELSAVGREQDRGPGESISPYKFMKKIERAIEEHIRPMLMKDGGDIEIIDIKDNLVYCRLKGACATCAAAERTLKLVVESELKQTVDERVRVIAV